MISNTSSTTTVCQELIKTSRMHNIQTIIKENEIKENMKNHHPKIVDSRRPQKLVGDPPKPLGKYRRGCPRRYIRYGPFSSAACSPTHETRIMENPQEEQQQQNKHRHRLTGCRCMQESSINLPADAWLVVKRESQQGPCTRSCILLSLSAVR